MMHPRQAPSKLGFVQRMFEFDPASEAAIFPGAIRSSSSLGQHDSLSETSAGPVVVESSSKAEAKVGETVGLALEPSYSSVRRGGDHRHEGSTTG
jgi:hypothetical protein